MATTEINQTRDHEEIKNWIQKNGGVPARLGYDSVGEGIKDPLTVWFRNEKDDLKRTYQELDWDEFFSVFDHHNFVFKFNNKTGVDRYCVITEDQN